MKPTLLPLALVLLASPVLAQEMPQDVAQIVSRIGLEDARWHPGRERADRDGRLGDTRVELDFHRGGALEEIEAHHDGLFDAAQVEPVLPEAMKQSADYPRGARFSKVELKDDEFELEGRTADGAWFEAEFDRHGRLEKWDRK